MTALPQAHTPRTVGITGASGFLGTHLVATLTAHGHRVVRFVRGRAAGPGEIAWDPQRGTLEPGSLDGLDAIVHLSGASIGDGAWTPARRRELVTSRVESTATLARALASRRDGPRVLVSTSAIGYYGDRGDEWLEETSPPGSGFLADLGRVWEAAADPAERAGVRVVHPRIGLVLWPSEGALAPLVRLTRWGAGGPLGSGRQWWSWVGLDDLLAMLARAVESDAFVGPFNAVAPEPIRQHAFAATLGRVLARPALLPAPALALRLVLGRDRADQLLLASTRVRPAVLQRLEHRWRDPELAPLLARMLGRARPGAAA